MRDTEILSALFETTRTLGIDRDLDSLLDLILDRARELAGFDHCALMIVDSDTDDLVVRSVSGYGHRQEEVRGLRLSGGEGLTGWAVQNRQAVRVGDVRKDPRYVAGLEEARSNLAVPLILENEVAGVLNVESSRPDAFDERHEKLLTVLGTQAALAIFAAQARTNLQRRIDQLDALYHISGLTWTDRTLEELATTVVEATARVVPSSSSALLLLDPTREALDLVAHVGYDEDVDGLRLPLDKGIVGRCARTGERQVIADVRVDPDYYQGVEGARCEVALPLEVQGQVIGVLDVESPRTQSIEPDQIRTLSMIANQVAAVLEAARVQEERLRLANTDALTGLANRRHFEEELKRTWHLALGGGQPLSLLILDLDHFKRINDEHGHDVGDRVLAGVAERLRGVVRQNDTLARIGGEEFAVIAAGADLQSAKRLAERLREGVEAEPLEVQGAPAIPLSVSVGVAAAVRAAGELSALFRSADQALYRAKREGRNQVVAG